MKFLFKEWSRVKKRSMLSANHVVSGHTFDTCGESVDFIRFQRLFSVCNDIHLIYKMCGILFISCRVSVLLLKFMSLAITTVDC